MKGRYYSIEEDTDFTNETNDSESTSDSDDDRNKVIRMVETQLQVHSEKIPFSLKEFLRFGCVRLPTDVLRCFIHAFLSNPLFTRVTYKNIKISIF